MADGVPIKVKIGLKPNGHADYPDWTQLPLAAEGAKKEDREALVSAHQLVKWHYDKAFGHTEEGPDSPVGMQWGMMVVTRQLADEALAMWPDRVFEMTDAEAGAFWETRCTAHMPRHRVQGDEIAALNAQRALMVARGDDITTLDIEIAKALDGDNPRMGVTRIKEKTWAGAKAKMGFAIASS